MISAAQSRVARTLLAWSQQELAREAGVGSSTIADFERGHRAPIENSIEAIKSTFERNGIRFVADSAVMETEINNIIVRTKLNQPLRWIDSTDLENWADRRDSQSTFPELISRLLIATYGPGVSIRFPSGDSVQFAGFDGISDAPVERHPVPAGKTVWELGTTGKSIKAKAQEDYAKRSQPSESILHSECTFAFVTLRRWPDKTKWAAARRIEKIWKNIIVIDADDLVHWLDQCPQAARWLAIRIGKRPNGIQGLEEKWSEWSNATHPSLNSAIVLISRDTEAATTLKWLKGDPAVFAIEADSANEALAFLCSTIFQLSDHMCNFQLSRAFVLNNPFDARELGQSASPLILCLSFIDAELAQSLASNGHHVFVACEHNETVSGNTLRLNRPDRYELKDQLVKILATDPERGVHNNNKRDIDNEAERLSKDSGRSLTILRRQIAAVPDRLPAWAKTPDRSLIAALLAGGWNGANEGDRHILSQLAGCPYDEFERRLAPILLVSDSPLRKSEDAWRIASPRDAFGLLSSCIVVQDLDLFVDAFDTVLSLPDPRFRLESSERWRASLSNMAPAHSPHLRRGLTETATLISVFHDNVRLAPDSYQRIERAVSDILKSANGEIWWSLHRELQNLAEAAPDAFLTALETKLDAKQSPLAELFKASVGPLGGEEYLSNLLWGLGLVDKPNPNSNCC